MGKSSGQRGTQWAGVLALAAAAPMTGHTRASAPSWRPHVGRNPSPMLIALVCHTFVSKTIIAAAVAAGDS